MNLSPNTETPELLHEAQKSTLADTLWTTANPNAASIPDNVRYVLDGGALLHRIPWSRGASYESILEHNILFIWYWKRVRYQKIQRE